MMRVRGFQTNGEYLDMEAKWLRARASRMAAEKELDDANARFQSGEEERPYNQSVQQIRCRAVSFKEAEDNLFREMDERIDAHREGDYPTLGIDVVSKRDRLTPEEGFVLVAVTLACLGNPLAEAIFGDYFNCYSGLQVSDAVRLLDAKEPSDWIRYRRMFLPDAPLVKNGHLQYDRIPQGPEGLMDATLSVGRETFALIIGGDPEPESYDDEEME